MRLPVLLAALVGVSGAWAAPGWEEPVLLVSSGVSSFRPMATERGLVVAWVEGVRLRLREPDGSVRDLAMPSGRTPEFDLLPEGEGYRGLWVVSSNLYRFRLDASGGLWVTNLGVGKVHTPRVFAGEGRFVEFYTAVTGRGHVIHVNISSEGFDPRPLPWGSESALGAFLPECVVGKDTLRVVFLHRSEVENRRLDSVWMTTSADGAVWTPPVRLGDPAKAALEGSVRGTEGDVTVVVSEVSTNREFSLTVMRGVGGGVVVRTFTDFVLPVFRPAVLRGPKGLWLVGHDRANLGGKGSVLVRRVGEDGSLGPVVRVSASNADAVRPVAVAMGGKMWMVWLQDGSGLAMTENDTRALAPRIRSPDVFEGYANAYTDPTFVWEPEPDPSGYEGFAVVLDRRPDTEPDLVNADRWERSRSFRGLEEGEWWFHVRAVDGEGNWSGTARFGFTVDTRPLAPPVVRSPTHPAFTPVKNDRPVFVWRPPEGERRKIVGYSTLLTTRADLEPDERIQTSSTSLPMPRLAPGTWHFMVRACDAHSNWSGYSTYTIVVEGPDEPVAERTVATQRGVYVYVIRPGDRLQAVIRKLFGLRRDEEAKPYLKRLSEYNRIFDPDRMRVGREIVVPAFVAEEDVEAERLAEGFWGHARYKDRIVEPGGRSVERVRRGETVLLRDPRLIRPEGVPRPERAP